MSFTITDGAFLAEWENVARVSSWFGLPWIMMLYFFLAIDSLRFHTFSTNGHVVLYFSIWIPICLSFSSIASVVPNAGMITMSSAVSCSNETSRSEEHTSE